MSGVNLFSGNAFSVADSKGRFVLPLDMRKMVKAASGGDNRLCIDLLEKHRCAKGFGTSHKAEMEDEIVKNAEAARNRGDAYDADTARELAFSSLEELNFDDGGRFFPPADIKEFCGIDDAIMFLGVGRFIQMWKPEAYLEYPAAREVIKARVVKFLAEREAVGK
ncbi:MAG: division/cell wall cluster transcriptional repressor MraZ [Sphingobium phenoxybenzoativorans]|uniref:division/cell wall cluster transcriptional repressor MraZ n=1 Tax=Sphingobium phenoxybenzoativorans TaxID=1592790 RepID=UPI000872CECE|nr:division/cell wall cluster transcriptional repressor MraZ [Sphingobium phenoxybenzoativorans]